MDKIENERQRWYINKKAGHGEDMYTTLYKNSAVQSQHMNMLASSCMEYIFARCITKSQEEIERSLCYLALCYSANELWHIFCL